MQPLENDSRLLINVNVMAGARGVTFDHVEATTSAKTFT